MFKELKLPIEKLEETPVVPFVTSKTSTEAHLILFILFFIDLPVDVAPLRNLIFLRVWVLSTLDAAQEDLLEPWYSKESNGDTNLEVAAEVGLYIFSSELVQAVVQGLMQQLLIKDSNLDLFLLDFLEISDLVIFWGF